jgi:hypothetical protein
MLDDLISPRCVFLAEWLPIALGMVGGIASVAER